MSEEITDWKHNRRGSDQRIEGLQRAVEDNTSAIADVSQRLEPMERVFDDVATVGRLGAGIKSFLLWVTGVGGSMLAIWHYISGIKVD
jgi:hypothetical protein